MKKRLEDFTFEGMQILCAGELDARPVHDEGELLTSDFSRRSSQYWLAPATPTSCHDDPNDEEA
jgi:hypothetical protein